MKKLLFFCSSILFSTQFLIGFENTEHLTKYELGSTIDQLNQKNGLLKFNYSLFALSSVFSMITSGLPHTCDPVPFLIPAYAAFNCYMLKKESKDLHEKALENLKHKILNPHPIYSSAQYSSQQLILTGARLGLSKKALSELFANSNDKDLSTEAVNKLNQQYFETPLPENLPLCDFEWSLNLRNFLSFRPAVTSQDTFINNWSSSTPLAKILDSKRFEFEEKFNVSKEKIEMAKHRTTLAFINAGLVTYYFPLFYYNVPEKAKPYTFLLPLSLWVHAFRKFVDLDAITYRASLREYFICSIFFT